MRRFPRWGSVLVLAVLAVPPAICETRLPPPAEVGAPESGSGEKPWLGVLLGDAVDGGVTILAVVPGGPAARAGLRAGDLVLYVGSREICDRDSIQQALETIEPGDPVGLSVLRDGASLSYSVRAGTRPPRSLRPPPVAPALPPVPRIAPARGACEALGVEVVSITPDLREHFGAPREAGVLVTRSSSRADGHRSDLRAGDVLTRLCGRTLRRVEDCSLPCEQRREARHAIEYVRDGRVRALQVELAREYPRTEAVEAVDSLRIRLIEAEIARLELRLSELQRELERLK